MATIEEGRFCQDDADCSEKQYCYDVSGQCVDYTQCNRYNRLEAQRFSRHPSQCGPCLPGHGAEILSTGEIALLCKKFNVHEKATEPIKYPNALIIWVATGTLLCCISAIIVGLFLRKRYCTRQENNRKQWGGLCAIGPSAPPAENSPFIGHGGRTVHAPFNNNQNLKDKNRLVSATPFKDPTWIRSNPNYEHNLNNDNLSEDEQSHSLAQLPAPDNNSNTWPAEQLAIQVPGASLAEYDVEQMDNSMNAVLVQRNNPSSSNASESNNNNNNNNNNSSPNNNNNGSTSEPNSTQDNRERLRGSNILITQKISMNVNVLNGDC